VRLGWPRALRQRGSGDQRGELSGPSVDFGRLDRLAFVARRPARHGLGGEHRSRRRAPSTEFVDYRPYAAGDDLRRLDWNVYGRLGTLQLKLTEARERLELVVLLDCSASMAWGAPSKLAFACQVARAFAYVGLARMDSTRIVRLGYPGASQALGPVRSRARFGEVSRFLAETRAVGAGDLNVQLAACADGLSAALVVLISDLLTPDGCERGLDALRRAGADIVVVHVLAPQERDPEVRGELELVDAESGQSLPVGLSGAALERYRARYAAWAEDRRRQSAAFQARHLVACSDRSVTALFLDDARRAGVLR
jgi:uncharacterized protein (DUF58 family)